MNLLFIVEVKIVFLIKGLNKFLSLNFMYILSKIINKFLNLKNNLFYRHVFLVFVRRPTLDLTPLRNGCPFKIDNCAMPLNLLKLCPQTRLHHFN